MSAVLDEFKPFKILSIFWEYVFKSWKFISFWPCVIVGCNFQYNKNIRQRYLSCVNLIKICYRKWVCFFKYVLHNRSPNGKVWWCDDKLLQAKKLKSKINEETIHLDLYKALYK